MDRTADRTRQTPSPCKSATPEREDGEGAEVHGPPHSDAMTEWIVRFHSGKFEHNEEGRGVLHEIIEQYRSKKEQFNKELFREAVSTTNFVHGGLEVKTNGRRPPATTAFTMLCSQAFKAPGCQPADYMDCLTYMLDRGANPNAKDARENTGLHLAVGSQNQAPIAYFMHMAASRGPHQFEWNSQNMQHWTVLNCAQGRNGQGKCKAILDMLYEMHLQGYIEHNEPESLTSNARKRKSGDEPSDLRKEREEMRKVQRRARPF